jgi:hypothetical protein
VKKMSDLVITCVVELPRWEPFEVYAGERQTDIQAEHDADGVLTKLEGKPSGFVGAVWADNGRGIWDFKGNELPYEPETVRKYIASLYPDAKSVTLKT